jgi:CHASE2 domain-containing sensor protein/tRNA A-37 threonylcarbamoyl transferase component Bud32
MNSQDSNLQSGASRLWPALALALIALTIGLFGRMNGLESLAYDYFQRYQYSSASAEIILLTVDSRAEMQKNIWEDQGFRQITNLLRNHGARLIVATHPLSLPDVPDEGQVNALIELQLRAQRMNPDTELPLSGKFREFNDRYNRRETLIEELQRSGDVVLATYSTSFAAENSSPNNCATHEVNLQGSAGNPLTKVRRVRYLATPPARVCNSVAAIGFGDFYPDSDGIVRSAELFINADGVFLPSLALATTAALEGDNGNIVIASSNTFSLRDQITRTSNGFRILNRYYNNTDGTPSFESATVATVLNQRINPELVKGRIVLIGETVNGDMPGLQTPINDQMAPMEVLATSLSNLLEGDYLLRPDWLTYIETGLICAIVLFVWLWMPALPALGAALLGLVLGMMILSVEAWLLVAEGIWAQLATVALIMAVSVWSMPLWQKFVRRQLPISTKAVKATAKQKPNQHNELDMEFSVLRQQIATAETKEKMYEIALIHGKAKEYARAESVLAYLAELDPDYKDVAKLLNKLSGAKQKKSAARKPGAANFSTDRKTLGRYEIDRVLGRGAMATVYLGRDPAINRKVAIKTLALAKEFDDDQLQEARGQFQREAESAGRLNHPNIIAIYDVGEDQEVSYLAMEYFPGNSLHQHAQPDDLLPPSWVLELVARAADALDYAHRQNVVHRDIKPANVLYNKANDSLKLTDFGIARLTDTSRTKTGVILGTPSYMSPEQLMGQVVSGKSDLYSLGVTMYQLLTGEAPFRADSIPSLMDKIMNGAHQPASELRPDLPGGIDKILNKAMSKAPANRFANGREMALELRHCIKDFKKTA